MHFPPLIPAQFIAREKRFLMHVRLLDGEVNENLPRRSLDVGGQDLDTAHCPNTGSLKSIVDRPIARVWLSDHGAHTTRKLRYTAEVVEFDDGNLAVINTGRANDLAKEALTQRQIPALAGYTDVRMEAKWDAETRFDALLTKNDKKCWVEVKSSTLQLPPAVASFPDAVTTRGQKHLSVLMQAVAQGNAACQLYLVLRTGSSHFSPAGHIDPTYATLLAQAKAAGVTVLCHEAVFERAADGMPTTMALGKALEVVL